MTTPDAAGMEMTAPSFTSRQYHWLIEAGILTTDDKVELIAGEIRRMALMRPAHRRSMRQLNNWLAVRAGDTYVLECQLTIELAEGFIPDPDFVLARNREEGYPEGHNPGKSDVLLVIEVAESDVEYNLVEKALAYARAGVPELWVVDIPHRQIHVLINPGPDGYQVHATAVEAESVTTLLIPSLTLPVAEVL